LSRWARAISAARSSDGAWVTVTLNDFRVVVPARSVAVHVRVVVPIGNVEPDGGVHETPIVLPNESRADAVYVTTAPLRLVALPGGPKSSAVEVIAFSTCAFVSAGFWYRGDEVVLRVRGPITVAVAVDAGSRRARCVDAGEPVGAVVGRLRGRVVVDARDLAAG